MREETIDTMGETNEAHLKQVLHMVLTRNRDSELINSEIIILIPRITKYTYAMSKFVRHLFYLPIIR